MAQIDCSIGLSTADVEQILAVHKAELKKTLASWPDSGSSATRRQVADIHEVIAACQEALRKLDPVKHGAARHVLESSVTGTLPKRAPQ